MAPAGSAAFTVAVLRHRVHTRLCPHSTGACGSALRVALLYLAVRFAARVKASHPRVICVALVLGTGESRFLLPRCRSLISRRLANPAKQHRRGIWIPSSPYAARSIVRGPRLLAGATRGTTQGSARYHDRVDGQLQDLRYKSLWR